MKSPITDTDEDREQFLKYEFFDWTIRAAFGRGNVYENTAGDAERENLRGALRSSLERLIPRYGAAVSDDDDKYHTQNIVDLSNELSEKHAGVLKDQRFRIGTAQKALNLYLKYLWCVGKVLRPPPHCPFDANIIGKLTLPNNCCRNWTQLDTIEDYRKWVVAARAEAGGMSLAVWELRLCNNDYR